MSNYNRGQKVIVALGILAALLIGLWAGHLKVSSLVWHKQYTASSTAKTESEISTPAQSSQIIWYQDEPYWLIQDDDTYRIEKY